MSGDSIEIVTDLFEQSGYLSALNASVNATTINHEGVSVVYADLNMDSDDFTNAGDGQLTADTMTLDVVNAFENSGLVMGSSGVEINADSIINEDTKGDDLNDFALGIQTGGELLLSANEVNNANGLLIGSGIGIDASTVDNNGGQVVDFGDGIFVTSSSVDNTDGRFESNGVVTINADVTNDGGMVYGSMGLVLTDVNNTNGQLLADAGVINIQMLDSDFINTNGSVISYDGDIQIEADDYSNDNGVIIAKNDASLVINSDFTSSGVLTADGDVFIGANSFNITDTLMAGNQLELDSAGGVTVGSGVWLYGDAGVSVNAESSISNYGAIESGGSVDVTTGFAFLNNGNINANGDVSIVGESVNSGSDDFTNNGTIATDGALSISFENDDLINSGSLISNGDMNLQAGYLTNNGLLYSNADLDANVLYSITNNDSILSAGDMTLHNNGSRMTTVTNDESLIEAQGNLTIRTETLNNLGEFTVQTNYYTPSVTLDELGIDSDSLPNFHINDDGDYIYHGHARSQHL